MGDFVYTTVPGKISELFWKVKEVGMPSKVNRKWLQSIGFSASNDITLQRILEYLDFVDASGNPTELWKQYRGPTGNQVLAGAVRKAYKELYETYPDAHTRSRGELGAFFSSHSATGKQAVRNMVSTFLELCKVADMNTELAPKAETMKKEEEEIIDDGLRHRVADLKLPRGFTVNINIQLTLPETTDEKVYETLFLAMKKHLLIGDI